MDVEQLDALSFEELDLLICSTKKQKASSQTFCPEPPALLQGFLNPTNLGLG